MICSNDSISPVIVIASVTSVTHALGVILIAMPLFSSSKDREKRGSSVLYKLVKRSRSLPRNMGRSKSRETIIAPDFYDINPEKTLTLTQNGK